MDSRCHPQSIAVVTTRAYHLGVDVVVDDFRKFKFTEDVCGVLIQYPDTDGQINDYRETIEKAHESNVSMYSTTIELVIIIKVTKSL